MFSHCTWVQLWRCLFSGWINPDVGLIKPASIEWITILYLDWIEAESFLKLRQVDSAYYQTVWKHCSQPASTHCTTCLSQCFLFVALCKALHTASQWVISLSRPTFYTQLYAHTHKMNKPRQAQHSHSHTAEHAGFPQKSKHLLCRLNPY